MYEVEIESVNDISETDLNDLRTLYKTPVGSIPLERKKGLDMSFISMPFETAKNMFAVEIIKKTRLYTGLEIEDISFYSDEDGKITAKVVVRRDE